MKASSFVEPLSRKQPAALFRALVAHLWTTESCVQLKVFTKVLFAIFERCERRRAAYTASGVHVGKGSVTSLCTLAPLSRNDPWYAPA